MRISRFIFASFITVTVFLTGLPVFGPSVVQTSLFQVAPAEAQTAKKRKRKSLFNIIFGRKKAKTKAVRKKTRKRVRRKTRSRKKAVAKKRTKRSVAARKVKQKRAVKRRVAVADPSQVETKDKAEDAKRVLVVGDFFGASMATGLASAFAAETNIVVVDRSKANSGFVRDDIVNWPEALPGLIEEVKPHYVVAMVGSNDRQLLRDAGRKLKKRTPDWDAVYAKRIDAFGVSLKKTGLPYSWVGLPPVRFRNMNRDFLIFNELYRKAALSERGEFIDIWDGFSDADGNYTRSGPDVNGQIVLLRPKGGVNMTKAGKERLAFYLQSTIKKTLKDGLQLSDLEFGTGFGGTSSRQAAYDPSGTGKTVVIRLNDPTVDGSDILAGEKVETNGGAGNVFAVPVLNGPARTVRKQGRVDDYSWQPSPTSEPRLPSTTVSASNN